MRIIKLSGEKLRERLLETTGKRCKEIADALIDTMPVSRIVEAPKAPI